MYKIEWNKEFPAMLVPILMAISAFVVYPYLPERLPIHWNLQGSVDGYVNKCLLSALLFPLMATGIYILMLFLPYIDPRRDKYEKFKGHYRFMRHLIVGFFAIVYIFVTSYALGYKLPVNRLLPAMVGLLFILMGNLMGKIRQNWFVGIRLPWTLSSENVWNKTHRLGGMLFVASGILLLFGLFLPGIWTYAMLLFSIVAILAGTGIYSYVIYKREIPGGKRQTI